MNTRNSRIALFMGLSLLIAGCTSSAFKAEVTRFHTESVESYLGQSIIIRPADSTTSTLEFSAHAALVGEKLGQLGFNPAGDQTPDIVARLQYLVTPVATASRSGASVSVGGGSFGRRSGVSGGVSFPVGDRAQDTIFSRRLDLVLIEEASGRHIWEGRALSEGRNADAAVIIPLLTDALFDSFPGPSGQTVTVKIDPDQ